MKLAVLASGGLGYDTLTKLHENYNIVSVLTDSKSEAIIQYCEDNNLLYFKGNPRGGLGYSFIKNTPIDVLVSINYLFLIEDDIINHPKQFSFNLHGSLLPKYRGRTPHVWAIINGETKAGITAHVIDSGCDTGQIIHQIEVPIDTTDTGAMMLNKYAKAYFPLVEKVLEDFLDGALKLTVQDDSQATYFGKRTPSDGEIDWSLSKEAIYNWVRAQSHPYPGAFTFYNSKKIIIDWVEFTDTRFCKELKDGTIIEISPMIKVKVSNGSIILKEIRQENCSFEVGKHFGNENRRQNNR